MLDYNLYKYGYSTYINKKPTKQTKIAYIQHKIHLNKRYKKSKNKIMKTIQTALKINYK